MAIAPPVNAGKAVSDKSTVPPSSEQLSTAEMERRIKLLQVDRYIYQQTNAQLILGSIEMPFKLTLHLIYPLQKDC